MPAPNSIAANVTSSRNEGGMGIKADKRVAQWGHVSENSARLGRSTIMES